MMPTFAMAAAADTAAAPSAPPLTPITPNRKRHPDEVSPPVGEVMFGTAANNELTMPTPTPPLDVVPVLQQRGPKRLKKTGDIMNAFHSISLGGNASTAGANVHHAPLRLVSTNNTKLNSISPGSINYDASRNGFVPIHTSFTNASEGDELLELDDEEIDAIGDQDDVDDDDDQSDESASGGCRLLSDQEEVERKVMLELVYGSNKILPRHPADLKVEEWIRREARLRQQREQLKQQQQREESASSSQDDMCLDHMSVYHRSSQSSSTTHNSTVTNISDSTIPHSPVYAPNLRLFAAPMMRARSNSLPNMEVDDTMGAADSTTMDMA